MSDNEFRDFISSIVTEDLDPQEEQEKLLKQVKGFLNDDVSEVLHTGNTNIFGKFMDYKLIQGFITRHSKFKSSLDAADLEQNESNRIMNKKYIFASIYFCEMFTENPIGRRLGVEIFKQLYKKFPDSFGIEFTSEYDSRSFDWPVYFDSTMQKIIGDLRVQLTIPDEF